MIQRAFCRNRANRNPKLNSANGIRSINHLLIRSRSEEGTCKSIARNTIQGPFRYTEQIKCNNKGIKPEVKKILICPKLRKGTAESSEATRFRKKFLWTFWI